MNDRTTHLVAILSMLTGLVLGVGLTAWLGKASEFWNVKITDVVQILTTVLIGTYVVFWVNKSALKSSLSFSVHSRVLKCILGSLSDIEKEFSIYITLVRTAQLNNQSNREACFETEQRILDSFRELNNHVNDLRVLSRSKSTLVDPKDSWKDLYESGRRLKMVITGDFPVQEFPGGTDNKVRNICCGLRVRIMELESAMLEK